MLPSCGVSCKEVKSSSCGYGQIYDGTFLGNLTEGKGIAAKLLEDNGIEITPEDEL